jgi:hypothetical protein
MAIFKLYRWKETLDNPQCIVSGINGHQSRVNDNVEEETSTLYEYKSRLRCLSRNFISSYHIVCTSFCARYITNKLKPHLFAIMTIFYVHKIIYNFSGEYYKAWLVVVWQIGNKQLINTGISLALLVLLRWSFCSNIVL